MSQFVSRMELVRRARSGVQDVLALLVRPTPEAIRECAVHLERAIETVRQLEACLAEPGLENPQVLRAELDELRHELARARTLLEHAFQFQAGWYRMLSGMLGGYSREGIPDPLRPGSRWVMEG